MDMSRQTPNKLYSASPLRFTTSFLLLTAGVAFAGMLCATGDYRNAIVATAVSLGSAFLLAAPVSIEAVLLAWFAATPFASFYFRYPLDRSIITFNRVVCGLLIVMLVLELRRELRMRTTGEDAAASVEPAILSVSRFEAAWAFLSVLALASAVARSNNVAFATRIAVDTFWLPLFVFHFARKRFDLRTGGRMLLLGCMAVALFVFATGAFELATGVDVFQYKGAELVREGERRVNGPFAADSSFAIICLILFLFLQAAPKLIRVRFDRTGRLVYACATAAAALGALLSLFRAVGFALVICWIAQRWFSSHPLKGSDLRRLLPAAALIAVMMILLGGWLATMVPSRAGRRLASARTAFGRLATWQAAGEIALENPAFGVGLANYAEHFDASHYYSDEPPEEVLDTKAADSPHSNVLWIASELGLPALGVYIAANLLLFSAGWRALKQAADPRRRIAASCFLAIVVAYWIPGLTLASGYYSDLNLCFLFLLGALSTQFSSAAPATEQFEAAVKISD